MLTLERKTIKIKAKIAEIENKPLPIRTPFIELQAALKLCGIAQTGGHAKILITEEQCVFVNGGGSTSKLYEPQLSNSQSVDSVLLII